MFALFAGGASASKEEVKRLPGGKLKKKVSLLGRGLMALGYQHKKIRSSKKWSKNSESFFLCSEMIKCCTHIERLVRNGSH